MVAGQLSADGQTWTSTDPLRVADHYRVIAAAVDSDGHRHRAHRVLRHPGAAQGPRDLDLAR